MESCYISVTDPSLAQLFRSFTLLQWIPCHSVKARTRKFVPVSFRSSYPKSNLQPLVGCNFPSLFSRCGQLDPSVVPLGRIWFNQRPVCHCRLSTSRANPPATSQIYLRIWVMISGLIFVETGNKMFAVVVWGILNGL